MSSLVTRVIKVGGRRTSVRLTPVEVDAIAEICEEKNLSTNRFCAIADEDFSHCKIRTQRIRMAILQYYMVRHQTKPASIGDTTH